MRTKRKRSGEEKTKVENEKRGEKEKRGVAWTKKRKEKRREEVVLRGSARAKTRPADRASRR